MHELKPVRVLYIMGTARSGSTILEILLSHGKGVFGAGELTALVKDGLIDNKPCACGRSFQECEVWGRVGNGLNVPREEYRRWAWLQQRMDWHGGCVRSWLGLVRVSDHRNYERYNHELLHAIHRVTRSAVIVDSSKYACRALAIHQIPGVELRVICLTRSPQGLLASFRKLNKGEQRPKSAPATVAYYGAVLLSLRIATWILPRQDVYFLTYERLLSEPENVLREIGQWSGIDLSVPIERLSKNGDFSVGHIVTGNRLRKRGRVRFDRTINEPSTGNLAARLMAGAMNGWRRLLGF